MRHTLERINSFSEFRKLIFRGMKSLESLIHMLLLMYRVMKIYFSTSVRYYIIQKTTLPESVYYNLWSAITVSIGHYFSFMQLSCLIFLFLVYSIFCFTLSIFVPPIMKNIESDVLTHMELYREKNPIGPFEFSSFT